MLRGANLGLRFLLELGALVAICAAGVDAVEGIGGWALGVAAAIAFAALWGLFVSPKARVALPPSRRFGVEVALWSAAAAAVASTGRVALAFAFLGVAVASGAVNYRLP